MRTIILLALLGLFSTAHAEIYRWTDAQGRVHFSERPRQGAQQVEVKPQVIQRDEQVRQREANMRRLQEVRGEERAAEQLQQAEQRARQQAYCDGLNNELARYDKRIYWYEEDSSGKKVEISPERVEERKMKLQTLKRERC
ncbi:DUF4124 domain-containing protein [Halopseudomonas sp.]|uniref:DUF4124 domain-containing protein n=1 Tax=Halopseudomonas sp. TaxID=2901191 RepID=UPI00356A0251